MPKDVVGSVPEFTQDAIEESKVDEGTEEVKEAATEEVAEPEKETPNELPAEEKPVDAEAEPQVSDDTKEELARLQELEKANQGLRSELIKKHKEIAELKGQKREIKSEEIIIPKKDNDDLKDLNSQDVQLIDRILRAKGMMTKEEFQKSTYEQVKTEELNKFLDKYPEYKPENDPGDVNWSALNRELGLYRSPNDPRQIREILERSHRNIAKIPSGQNVSITRRQMQTAGVGSGGAQRSSAQKSYTRFTPAQRAFYEKGGWSEAEINDLEQNLPKE